MLGSREARQPSSCRKKLVLKKGMKLVNKTITRWRRQWLEAGSRPSAEKTFSKKMCYGSVPHQKRQRVPGGGRMVGCAWVREILFEWSVSMRYSIDWKWYNERLSSCGRRKAMGRFQQCCCVRKQINFCWTMCVFVALQVTAEAEEITAVAA